MKYIKYIVLGFLITGHAFILYSQQQQVYKRVPTEGIVLVATNTNGSLTLSPARSNTRHRCVLSNFSCEVRTNVTPLTCLLSGTVMRTDTHYPIEHVAIFFGSSLHSPSLAALTDSKGMFNFQTRFNSGAPHSGLQYSSITNAAIYVVSENIYFTKTFDKHLKLSTGLVRKYPLSELISLEEAVQASPAATNR